MRAIINSAENLQPRAVFENCEGMLLVDRPNETHFEIENTHADLNYVAG